MKNIYGSDGNFKTRPLYTNHPLDLNRGGSQRAGPGAMENIKFLPLPGIEYRLSNKQTVTVPTELLTQI
jgi:hypothetical protein